MTEVVALSEIFLSHAVVEWTEAIAIVRAVTAALLANDSRGSIVPDLQQINLLPTGDISVIGGSRSSDPVRRMGQLLQAALGQSEPPVQLRLILSQATSPTPPFNSIEEFDRALEYFERPDRQSVLRSVHGRAVAALALRANDPSATPTLDSVAPLEEKKKKEDKKRELGPAAKRRERVVAFFMALLLLGVAGVQYVRMNRTSPQVVQMSIVADRVTEKVGKFIRDSLSSLSERVGFGRLVWSEAAAATPESLAPPATDRPVTPANPVANVTAKPAAAPADIKLVRTRRPRPSPPVEPVSNPEPEPEAVLAFDLEPVVPPALAELDDSPVNSAEETPSAVVETENEVPFDPAFVYSATASEVVPPVAVRPQLPTELPENVRREDLISIELVVALDGTVESVRLLGGLQGLGDWLWLSTVKAWQFRPAMKDGHPVPYRKTVWIAYPCCFGVQ